MEERRVALIPSIMVSGAMGPRIYALLLTTSRSIFVLENASKAGIGAVLGGAIGAAIADAMNERKRIDYSGVDLSVLAADEANTCIPHSSVRAVQLKRRWTGYHIRYDYTDAAGKERKIAGTLTLPDELAARKSAEGVKASVALEEYARMAKQAVERALPPSVAQYAELEI